MIIDHDQMASIIADTLNAQHDENARIIRLCLFDNGLRLRKAKREARSPAAIKGHKTRAARRSIERDPVWLGARG